MTTFDILTSKPAMATALGLMLLPAAAIVTWQVAPDLFGGGSRPEAASTELRLRPAPQGDRTPANKRRADTVRVSPTAPQRARSAQTRIPFAEADRSIAVEPVAVPPVLTEAPVLTQNDERSPVFSDGGFKSVTAEPVSTFSSDVDTASYARVRRAILDGQLPPRDMVRAEEMVNAFDYDYPVPEAGGAPFSVSTSLVASPWSEGAQLLHIGVQGLVVPEDERKAANLVFLIDTSGSMNAPDKLPLLRRSFQLLLSKLGEKDTVSIVTYAGSSAVVLEPTPASAREKIVSALENLRAGGGTAGANGIRTAYDLARRSFVEDGTNRVMLATDGDFNVGLSNPAALADLIAKERESGVYLSVLGFGRGNLRDDVMQKLAQNGNGIAAYIDTLAEARRVMVTQSGSTLMPIADDLKLQVEFNPAAVSQYRLVGYETRALAREDFNDDKVDAGDIGSGHSVTAIYEILPVGVAQPGVDPLRYGERREAVPVEPATELGFVKLRYKGPGATRSKLVSQPIGTNAVALGEASTAVRFATAVAGFAQKLRGVRQMDDLEWTTIAQSARAALGADTDGRRAEFARLVDLVALMKAN